MAIVTGGFKLSISVADNGADVSTLSWDANTGVITDFATAQAQRDLLVADLAAITDSVVVATRLIEEQYEDTIVYPAAGVENENKASITYLIDGTNKKGNIKIPAPKQAIFSSPTGPSSKNVDVGNGLVVAYMANFESTGGWFVSDGESVGTTLKGKRISAKNNYG
jgi:hypothetical protein